MRKIYKHTVKEDFLSENLLFSIVLWLILWYYFMYEIVGEKDEIINVFRIY